MLIPGRRPVPRAVWLAPAALLGLGWLSSQPWLAALAAGGAAGLSLSGSI
jgi:hypothetical protein